MEQRPEQFGFVEPSTEDFFRILGSPQSQTFLSRGGGLQDIVIYTPHKRGGGFLNFVRKTLLPFLKPHLLSFGSNVLGDMAKGSDLKTTLSRRALESASEIGQRVVKGGAKRKRRRVKLQKRGKVQKKKTRSKKARPCKRKRKRNKLDIFQNI